MKVKNRASSRREAKKDIAERQGEEVHRKGPRRKWDKRRPPKPDNISVDQLIEISDGDIEAINLGREYAEKLDD